MDEKHYKETLSAFVNHELPKERQQLIAAHLLQCAVCRREYDEIKFGSALAGNLRPTDAPEAVWQRIENELNAPPKAFPVKNHFFNQSILTVATVAVLITAGLSFLIYFAVRRENPNDRADIQAAPTESKKSDEWIIETLAGNPRAENRPVAENEVLTVGETLETDADSRARVLVADIGQIELAPNSRVQLIRTGATEHRLSLERGVLQAQIFAPPRLFIVDTPDVAAVDLGCGYTLEVDERGDARLHVTSGFVALERAGRESLVSAGAIAITRRGKGIGTPFSDKASGRLQDALYQFDFENGGRQALATILVEAGRRDALTLWHLLSRVEKPERGKIFEALASQIKPPAGVTREGILKLDKSMLKAWQTEIEAVRFE